MKKIILSLFTIIIFVIYVLYFQSLTVTTTLGNSITGANNVTTENTNTAQNNPKTTNTTENLATKDTNTITQTNSNSTNTSTTSTALFKDGNYTGISANAYYGEVQVQAIIRNGLITDIKFLKYPTGRGTTMMVTNYSLPLLKSEAISKQSANVDTISGATLTSEAFKQSLSSALVQARA